jgi:hypothetical protein
VELRMPLPVPVDVFPCLRVRECKLIWHQPYNGTILVV